MINDNDYRSSGAWYAEILRRANPRARRRRKWILILLSIVFLVAGIAGVFRNTVTGQIGDILTGIVLVAVIIDWLVVLDIIRFSEIYEPARTYYLPAALEIIDEIIAAGLLPSKCIDDLRTKAQRDLAALQGKGITLNVDDQLMLCCVDLAEIVDKCLTPAGP